MSHISCCANCMCKACVRVLTLYTLICLHPSFRLSYSSIPVHHVDTQPLSFLGVRACACRFGSVLWSGIVSWNTATVSQPQSRSLWTPRSEGAQSHCRIHKPRRNQRGLAFSLNEHSYVRAYSHSKSAHITGSSRDIGTLTTKFNTLHGVAATGGEAFTRPERL
jgi:hypothetical protein